MDEPTRRAWSRPELIVLVRSGQEEAVLGSRKIEDESRDVNGSNAGCWVDVEADCGVRCH